MESGYRKPVAVATFYWEIAMLDLLVALFYNWKKLWRMSVLLSVPTTALYFWWSHEGVSPKLLLDTGAIFTMIYVGCGLKKMCDWRFGGFNGEISRILDTNNRLLTTIAIALMASLSIELAWITKEEVLSQSLPNQLSHLWVFVSLSGPVAWVIIFFSAHITYHNDPEEVTSVSTCGVVATLTLVAAFAILVASGPFEALTVLATAFIGGWILSKAAVLFAIRVLWPTLKGFWFLLDHTAILIIKKAVAWARAPMQNGA